MTLDWCTRGPYLHAHLLLHDPGLVSGIVLPQHQAVDGPGPQSNTNSGIKGFKEMHAIETLFVQKQKISNFIVGPQ
jgi:hypothetical protein